MKFCQSNTFHALAYLLVSSLVLSDSESLLGNVTPTPAANQHIVSLNSEAGWELNAELNNAEGRYKIGEKLNLRFCSPSKDCYVHIFNISPDGKTSLIWPNDYCKDNKVVKATTIQYPTPGSNVTFRARAPIGKELLVLLATERPLNLRDQEQSAKLAEFLDAAKSKPQATVSRLRSLMVEQEMSFGWTGKAIELTTYADVETIPSGTPSPQVYRPAIGEFSIQAVGDFKLSKSENGIVTHFHSNGSTAFTVAHTCLPGMKAAETQEVLKRLKEAQQKELQGTVISEQVIRTPGGLGLEFTIQYRLDGRDCLMMSRVVSVGSMVYLITVCAPEAGFSKPIAEEFLQSFKAESWSAETPKV